MESYFKGSRLTFSIRGPAVASVSADELGQLLGEMEHLLAPLSGEVTITATTDACSLREVARPSGDSEGQGGAPANFVERIELDAPEALAFSSQKERILANIVNALRDHLGGRRQKSLVVCIQGPPGTGKSTIAREAARRAGLEAYRPLNIQSIYVGQTAERIGGIFASLKDKRAALLWDEIDSIASERSAPIDAATRDHRDIMAALLRALDEAGAVLITTTNAGAVLDAAFRSRAIGHTYCIGALDLRERADALRAEAGRSGVSLDTWELQDLAAASQHLSFRDLQALCRNVVPVTPPLTRTAAAWRRAFSSVPQEGAWSSPVLSHAGAKKTVWKVSSTEFSGFVSVASKDDCGVIARLEPHGYLSEVRRFLDKDDVNAVLHDRRNDCVVLATDKDLSVRLGALTSESRYGVRKLNGYAYDADWVVPGETMLVARKGGHVELCTVEGGNLTSASSGGDVGIKLRASVDLDIPVRSVALLKRMSGDFECCACGSGPKYWLLRGRTDGNALEIVSEISLPHPFDSDDDKRRLSVVTWDDEERYIVVPAKMAVCVYRWAGGARPELVHAVQADGDCPPAACDSVSGQLAIGAGNVVRILPSFLPSGSGREQRVELPDGAGSVTTMTFAQFGRALVIGTSSGNVFTAQLV